MLVVVLTLLLTAAAAVSGQTVTECRVCPGSCLAVPRSDGSCPVCICDGVALADCPSGPVECMTGCSVQLAPDGCRRCACPQRDRVVCPALPSCPEDCQQNIDDNGCPVCACDTPQRACPDINCPQECNVEVGEDGCPTCRCDPAGECPAVPACLRGCIERDENRACFFCNCLLVDTDASDSFGGDSLPPWSFGRRPFGFDSFDDDFPLVPQLFEMPPFGLDPSSRRPIPGFGQVDGPSPRCRQEQRLLCPPGCRMAVAAHGCRECFCGDDAYLCPGVPRCASRCQFLSPEDRCCRCQCRRRRPSIVTGGLPFGPFTPLLPMGPIRPNTIHRIFISLTPVANPDRDVERNCTQEPTTCDRGCRLTQDSDGCRLCVCPGDLCPRIRCPERCVQGLDSRGCPICDCGGRPRLPSQSEDTGNTEVASDSENDDGTSVEPEEPLAVRPSAETPAEPDATALTDSAAAATDADAAAQTDLPPTTPTYAPEPRRPEDRDE